MNYTKRQFSNTDCSDMCRAQAVASLTVKRVDDGLWCIEELDLRGSNFLDDLAVSLLVSQGLGFADLGEIGDDVNILAHCLDLGSVALILLDVCSDAFDTPLEGSGDRGINLF